MLQLVRIKQPEFDVEIDLRYATTNNFTGKPIYKSQDCYLHEAASKALKQTIKLAAGLGYRIKIFDAYRPTEAQFKLWEHTPDPSFLANPVTGSPHSRGVAIDLTLIDSKGKELDMGTDFDAFTPKSFHSDLSISVEAQTNRRILLGLMTAGGWDWYENEWWHYQLNNPRAYRLWSDKDAGTELI